MPKAARDKLGNKGKIDIPRDFWKGVDLKSCSDYEGTEIDLTNI